MFDIYKNQLTLFSVNKSTKVEALLAEIKDNAFIMGEPPAEFSALCEYVTKWLIYRYDLKNDASINYGYCFIWAYLVWALWPGDGVSFVTTAGHVVVKFNNNYYDSEHCEGQPKISNWCGMDRDRVRKVVDVKTMCWYWSRAGRYLKEFRRVIRKTHPALYKSVRDNGNHNWADAAWVFMGCSHIHTLPEVA